MKTRLTVASRAAREVHFRDSWLRQPPRALGAEAYLDWLTHTGSLTARLRRSCANFRVRLIKQTLARPFEDERRALGLRLGRRVLVREVLLCCGDVPIIFAHTVLPSLHAQGAWHVLAGLGTRPLGELLFTDPLIAREPLRYARIDTRHRLYARARSAAGEHVARALWARRSLFLRAGRAILVSEIFLPAVLGLAE